MSVSNRTVIAPLLRRAELAAGGCEPHFQGADALLLWRRSAIATASAIARQKVAAIERKAPKSDSITSSQTEAQRVSGLKALSVMATIGTLRPAAACVMSTTRGV